MNLTQISKEYRANILILENRVNELNIILAKTHGSENIRKLKSRINTLNRFIAENYETVLYLERYYED